MISEKFALIYDPIFAKINFGYFHNLQGERFSFAWDFFNEIGLLKEPNMKILRPRNATVNELKLAHTTYYINKVKKMSNLGKGKLSKDTPVFKNLYEKANLAVGGSILALEEILGKKVNHAMCLSSGFHHAFPDRGEGFCVFNDIVIISRILLEKGYRRILIIDIDSHFSNAVSYYFYDSPNVLVLSFHESPKSIYPRICGFEDEIGIGKGKGYTINVPFPERTNGDVFIEVFDAIIPLIYEKFQPDFILYQCGTDGHKNDLISHLNYSKEVFHHASQEIHQLSKEFSNDMVMLFAGGGYENYSTSWNWAITISNFLNIKLNTSSFIEENFWEDNTESRHIMRKKLEKIILNINNFL